MNKRRHAAAAAVVAIAIATPAHAIKVVCADQDTGRKSPVAVAAIRKQVHKLRRTLRRRSIHVLDLSTAARAEHRALVADWDANAWCRVRIEAQTIAAAVAKIDVAETFVAEKLGRVRRFVARAATTDARRQELEELLEQAEHHLEKNRPARANRALSRILALLLGSDDPWLLPSELPWQQTSATSESAPLGPRLPEDDVAEACPELANKHRATATEVDKVRQDLKALLDERGLRPLDVADGDALVSALIRGQASGAYWPAAQAACVLKARLERAEVDLGLVMTRFRAVNRRQDHLELDDPTQARFGELVRRASDAVAAREFRAAYDLLEQLLILIGEPQPPSATLDPARASAKPTSPGLPRGDR